MDGRNVHAALNIAFCHTLDLGGSLNLTEAMAEIAASILRFPGEARLYIHQAELYESAGMLDEAEARYVRALQADAYCMEAYDLLGRLREATGNSAARDGSARVVDATLKRMKSNEQDVFAQTFALIARARFLRTALHEHEAVDAGLRQAASETTDAKRSAQAAALRAHLLEIDGRRAEAILVLDQACAKHAGDARAWFERGTLALRSGEIDVAVAAFDKASLAAPQSAPGYHSLRFAFEGYRRYRAERVRFESVTRANPRDGLAHHHMALAALSVLKNEEALFHFTRAQELDPRLSDAACGRGRALQRMGHFEEAESAYGKALEIDPENAEAQRSIVALRTRRLAAAAIVPTPK
jgi:tetratricopeptide (TPR) repeat protein